VPGLLLVPERGETAAVLAVGPLDGRPRPRALGSVLESCQPGACLLPAGPCPRERLARLEQAVLGVAVRLLAEPVQLGLISPLGVREQPFATGGQRPLLGMGHRDRGRRSELSLARRYAGQQRTILGRQRAETLALPEEHQVQQPLFREEPRRLEAIDEPPALAPGQARQAGRNGGGT